MHTTVFLFCVTHFSFFNLLFLSCLFFYWLLLIYCTIDHFYHGLLLMQFFFLISDSRNKTSEMFWFVLLSTCHALVVKCILVASPGFVKDQFIAYLFKEAVRQDNKILLENRPKFMLVHSSSGHKYSLKGRSRLVMGIKQSHLNKGWNLTEMFVLQKSSLIPLWQAGCQTPRWKCICALFVLYKFRKVD